MTRGVQQGEQNAIGAGAAVLVAMLVVSIIGAWWLLKDYILFGSMYASYYIYQGYDFINGYIPFMTKAEAANVKGAIQMLTQIDARDGDFAMFRKMAEMHGYFQRWLLIPFAIYTAWYTRKRIVRFKYRRKIRNIYDLIDIQAKHFGASALVKGANILADHKYIGPYATYSLPIDIALDNGLLWAAPAAVEPKTRVDREVMSRIPALTPDEKLNGWQWRRANMPHYSYVLLDYSAAFNFFAGQLGPKWNGWENLPDFEKALYAICCIQGAGRLKEAQGLMDQINMSFKMGKYDRNKTGKMLTPCQADFSGVDEAIKKYGDNPQIKAITKQHHHRYSVLIQTLAYSRRKGRLMHSNVLWIKWVNRTLGYGVIGLGGQAPYWEAAGIFTHMQAETMAKRPLAQPQVAGAVLALEDQMMREHWIDPGEYGKEHQQQMLVEENARNRKNKAGQKKEQEVVSKMNTRGGGAKDDLNRRLYNEMRGRSQNQNKGEDEP